MNHRITIRRASALLESGAISSVDLASFCHSLAVAGETVWGLNAFERLVGRDDLLDNARASDDRRRVKESLSLFDGIPISFKSNIAVSSQPLTAGSKILGMGQKEVPSVGYDADVVSRLLQDSGSLLLGITSMDEFGMGSLGNTAILPDGTRRWTKNPLPLLHKLSQVSASGANDEDLVAIINLSHDEILELHRKAKDLETADELYSAGGSSCGSAASVAHGSSLLSLGTDTGGSVRLPSAWCGLVGLKPSYGLFSRHGIVSYASSFDTVGVLAKSVDCATLAHGVLAQREGDKVRDSTASTLPSDFMVDEESIADVSSLTGVRIGIPAAFSVEEMPAAIRDAWSGAAEYLHQQGAEVKEISTTDISPSLVQNALAAYYVLVSAEASSNLSRYDGFRYGVASETPSTLSGLTPLERKYAAARTRGFGDEVARRVLCGTSVLSSDHFHTHYEAAAKLRAVLSKQLRNSLSHNVDAILIPTALSLPTRLDQGEVDSTEMFANDIMTVPASLAGLPVLTIPVQMSDHGGIFKAGMSLIGPRLHEMDLLKIGRALEVGS